MRFNTFLAEALRSMDLKPEKEDPKAATTPMRQKLRQRDLGPTETVARIAGRRARNSDEFVRDAQKVATAATGVRFGDKQDPEDAAADAARGPAAFQRQRQDQYNSRVTAANKLKGASAQRAEKEKIDKEFGGDPNKGLKQAHPEYKDRLAAVENDKNLTRAQKRAAREKVKQEYGGDFEKLSTAERMALSVDALQKAGRGSRESETMDAFRDARIAAEKPRMRGPIQAGNRTIYDSPGLRHGLQGSEFQVPDLPKIDLANASGDELLDAMDARSGFVNSLYSINQDPTKAAIRKPDGTLQSGVEALGDRSGVETTQVRSPTARDLEQAQKGAEDKNAGEAYYTPEVKKYQDDFRKAVSTMDNEAVQKLAFTHEIDDELLDDFINEYGQARGSVGKEGKMKLISSIESKGLEGVRYKSAYGGDIFDGDVPDEFKPKKKENGKWVVDEDAPEGVYDLQALKKADKKLYDKAILNRGKEMTRTYMKQGGRDAYARHEGTRAMNDMDLEHIKSLNAEAKDGEEGGGGYDHPNNWVWASGQLNKLRGAEPLDKRTEKFVAGKPGMGQANLTKAGHSFNTFIAGLDDDKKKEVDNLKTIKLKKNGKMSTNASDFLNRKQEDIESDRETLKKMGMPEDQIKQLTPDVEMDPQTDVLGYRDKVPGQKDRVVGTPFLTNPDQYETDIRTQERDETMFNKGIQAVKDQTGVKTEDEALTTPQGIEFAANMAELGASQAPEDKPKKKDDKVTPKDILDLGGADESEVDDIF